MTASHTSRRCSSRRRASWRWSSRWRPARWRASRGRSPCGHPVRRAARFDRHQPTHFFKSRFRLDSYFSIGNEVGTHGNKNKCFFQKRLPLPFTFGNFLLLWFGALGDRTASTMVSYLHTAYCNVRLWRNQFFSPQFNFWAVFCLCFFSHVNGIG